MCPLRSHHQSSGLTWQFISAEPFLCYTPLQHTGAMLAPPSHIHPPSPSLPLPNSSMFLTSKPSLESDLGHLLQEAFLPLLPGRSRSPPCVQAPRLAASETYPSSLRASQGGVVQLRVSPHSPLPHTIHHQVLCLPRTNMHTLGSL